MFSQVIPYVINAVAKSLWGTPHEGAHSSHWGMNNNTHLQHKSAYMVLKVLTSVGRCYKELNKVL